MIRSGIGCGERLINSQILYDQTLNLTFNHDKALCLVAQGFALLISSH